MGRPRNTYWVTVSSDLESTLTEDDIKKTMTKIIESLLLNCDYHLHQNDSNKKQKKIL